MDTEDQKKPSEPELDEVTRQLREEFALLDKIVEFRMLAKGHPNAKQSRKASRAAARAAIKSSKESGKGHWSLKAPKLKPSATTSKWIEKVCWRCKSRFKIHAAWTEPPTLCKSCTKYLDETYLPSGPDHSTPFTSIYFVSGGAPGTGKRR